MARSEQAAGYGFALLAAILWGLIGPVAKLAFREGIAPLELAFWRAALAGMCFLTWTGLRGRLRFPARRSRLAAYLLFGLVGVALFYAAYHRAVEAGGAALASALLYTAPAQVAVLSATLFSAPLTRRKAGAALLATAGAAGVALGGKGSGIATESSFAMGVLWGLVASLCYVFYYFFGRHFFQEETPALVYAWAFPLGTLCLLPAAGTPGAPLSLSGLSLSGWGAILWIGIASTFLAYLSHGEALRRLEATRASVVTTLEPVVAGVVAYLWWNERLGTIGWLGGGLIVAGALLAATEREDRSLSPMETKSTSQTDH